MKKLLAICALSFAAVCSFAATTIAGSYAWINGTLAAAVTPSNSPQTVKVTVGTTTTTVLNTLVIGPTTTALPVGTPFAVLKAGSTPFSGTFMATSLEAFVNGDVTDRTSHRTVPMTNAGVLSDSIGFVAYGNTTALTLFFPALTVGAFSFPNGLEEFISAPLGHFSIYLPTTTSPASGTVTFPTGSAPCNVLRFTCLGGSLMDLGGQSTSNVVAISGGIANGTSLVYTSAILRIQNFQN